MAVDGYFGNVNYTYSATKATGAIRGNYFENTVGNGNIIELGFRLNGPATGHLRLGVYADSGSATQPGALLLDAGEITDPVLGWNTITGLSLAVVRYVYYWLVWTADVEIAYRYTTGTYYGRTFTYGALPDPFGTASSNLGLFTLRAGVEITGTSLKEVINE